MIIPIKPFFALSQILDLMDHQDPLAPQDQWALRGLLGTPEDWCHTLETLSRNGCMPFYSSTSAVSPPPPN